VTRKVDNVCGSGNESLIKVIFNSTFAKLTVITCYVLTELAEDDIKVMFYEHLEEQIRTPPPD